MHRYFWSGPRQRADIPCQPLCQGLQCIDIPRQAPCQGLQCIDIPGQALCQGLQCIDIPRQARTTGYGLQCIDILGQAASEGPVQCIIFVARVLQSFITWPRIEKIIAGPGMGPKSCIMSVHSHVVFIPHLARKAHHARLPPSCRPAGSGVRLRSGSPDCQDLLNSGSPGCQDLLNSGSPGCQDLLNSGSHGC